MLCLCSCCLAAFLLNRSISLCKLIFALKLRELELLQHLIEFRTENRTLLLLLLDLQVELPVERAHHEAVLLLE